MMVAGAKADLLRTGDYNDLTTQSERKISAGFPGGWGSAADNSEDPLRTLPSMGHALPRRERANSHSSTGSSSSRSGGAKPHKTKTGAAPDTGAYIPLIPTYAISPSDPIPRGYVEHARDACVEVDYQWDSMREPQNWGSGGEYGEEWGAMHKRYRTAIQKMLSWYRDHGAENPTQKAPPQEGTTDAQPDSEHESDPEIVLILVSHGAGCNAIIGGLTDRTVLLDVGMASLTMAVRKDAAAAATHSSSVEAHNGDAITDPRAFLRRKSSVTIPVSDDYEIKLMASTDHLRSTGNPLHPPPLTTSQSFTAGAGPSSPSSSHRYRAAARNNSMDELFTIGEPRHTTTSTAIGSIRRTTSQRSSSPLAPRQSPLGTSPVAPSSFTGLWNRPAASDTTTEDEDGHDGLGDDMVLNFGDAPAAERPRAEHLLQPPSASTPRADSHRGLWGSSAVAEERKDRDDPLMPKRRWTVHERAR
jgi:hypothetical protein